MANAEAANLFLRRDLRFTVDESARAATISAMTLRNWLKRGVAAVSQKDMRLGRWLLDATDVLAIRIQAELQQQCGTDPMQTRDTAKGIAKEWYTRHAELGDDGPLECLVALNDGSPIVVFLPPTPEGIPAKVAAKMLKDIDHEYKLEEIMSGPHLRIPVHTLAEDVQTRLSNILREQGE